MWLVDDPLFDQHRARGYHPERPERLVAARKALDACRADGFAFDALAPRDATPAEIALVHEDRYVEALEKLEGVFAALDDDTYLAPASVAAAYRAAGGGMALVDALLDATSAAGSTKARTKGVALLRPPGHHARPDVGMGFCLLNNIAVAARHALGRGIERVAIVDFDVHHGNGTQAAFYDDPRVLFTSLHQYPFYPGTGAADETGTKDGVGYTVNVPLSQSASDVTYRAAFDRVVVPVLEAFSPQLVLVSAGFDAHVRDPLAGMAVSAAGYREMTRSIAEVAERTAGGRVGLFLEGGYDLEGLSTSLAAAIRGLCGVGEPPADPGAYASVSALDDVAPLSQRHGLEIERSRREASAHWKL